MCYRLRRGSAGRSSDASGVSTEDEAFNGACQARARSWMFRTTVLGSGHEKGGQGLHALALLYLLVLQLPVAVTVGAVLVPEYVPWKPNDVEPPGATVPFQFTLVAVTDAPDCETVPFQALVIFWLPA